MAITIRDTGPGAPPVTRNIASLVGGYVIAAGCFVLCLLVLSEFTSLGWATVAGAALFAVAVGIWIRIADL